MLITALTGFRICLHISRVQQVSSETYALSNGPWAETSIWEAADGKAYLLSPKTSDAKYADVTAYFCFDEGWHPFRMHMAHGSTLTFEDGAGDVQFTGDFRIEDGEFTVKDLQASGERMKLPQYGTYAFTKTSHYHECVSQLPFDF